MNSHYATFICPYFDNPIALGDSIGSFNPYYSKLIAPNTQLDNTDHNSIS